MPCRFGLWDIAKQLDAVFAQMDIDGDGVLTPDEFLEGFGTTSFAVRLLDFSKLPGFVCRTEFCGRGDGWSSSDR